MADCHRRSDAIPSYNIRRAAQSYGLQYSRASARPAAKAISGKGRPRRWSAKNRRPFDIKMWLNHLRCQSSLAFGGMTNYLFIKQALRLRLVRVVRAAASPQRRPAVVRTSSHRALRRLLPENFPINDACGSLSRAVRRRPPPCGGLLSHSDRRRRTATAFTSRRLRNLYPKTSYHDCF